MRKTFFIAILFAITMFVAVDCVAQTDYQFFVLTFNGKAVTVNLPKEVPDMKDAKHSITRCFDARLCVDQYVINEDETLLISFWYHKGDIIGFVFHDLTGSNMKHTPWFYSDSVPTLTTSKEFKAKLAELYRSG